ncbi:TPA: hypothetical protein NH084_004656 [Pseudomonas aeruginosa]|uniref:hypothetical protein n=1 Tax=Pseudomonas aeruginosa TaxID=287 RepID=UPI0015564AC4|nr:hypothetical protein [Pseudomonas aeruginosa]EJY6173875.1 hypothetical protein [Pseudomonas aeruginosa]EKF7416934.1 hypothetical protein [Pseudomonas aeruginosa]MBH3599911.1 hypothetical protein [Pseudomonas aeruginosa]NPY24880.1 hypothetical protein [Pseudomonas aeruginosa]HCE7464645.1 hypothetical protein [Pseudomonas aeruginosa]
MSNCSTPKPKGRARTSGGCSSCSAKRNRHRVAVGELAETAVAVAVGLEFRRAYISH